MMSLRSFAGVLSANAVERRFLKRPFLVVDWMTTGVVLSKVELSGENVSLHQTQFEEWPAGLEPLRDPERAGQWLRSVCDRTGLPCRDVAISVPRRDLSIRLLELPVVSDDELGPLVSLQVESRTQLTSQPVAWDCLAHPAKEGDTTRYVVLTTIPAAVFDAISAAGRAAGWSNVMMTSGDMSICLSNSPSDCEWQVYIQANPVKLELLLCHGGLLVSSYATAMPADGASVAGSIVQSMICRLIAGCPMAWQKSSADTAIVVSGSLAQALGDELSRMGMKVAVQNVDDRAPRALAVARSILLSKYRIDFLRPRSADPRTGVRRRRRITAGVLALAGVLVAFAGILVLQESLSRELTQLENEQQQLQQYIERGQAAVERWSYLSRWQNRTVNSAAEIREIAELLPERDRLMITRLQLENLVDAEDSLLRIDGLAKDPADVLTLNAAILEHPERYDLRPQGIEPAPEGSLLPSQFRIEVLLRDGHSSPEEVR